MSQGRASWTGLHQAVSEGDVQLVHQLLSTHTEAQVVNSRDDSGWTPLHVAARLGHLPSLRLLLQDPRLDVEARDNTKCTALRHALGTGHNAAACELLMAGADARSGLLPFIMLDTYNRLMNHMHQAGADLEAELEPHRVLRHRLALLLLKHGIQLKSGSTIAQSPSHAERVSRCDKDADQHTAPDQYRAAEQVTDQHKLTGVHRDAAEIQQAAHRVKQLRQELERYKLCPMPPVMVHAIVAIVQASKDAAVESQQQAKASQLVAVPHVQKEGDG